MSIRRLTLLVAGMAVVAGSALLAQSTGPATTRPGGGNAPPASQPAASNPAAPEPQLQDKRDRLAEVVARILSNKHGWTIWRNKSALQADFAIEFPGQPAMEGTMIYDINRGRSRIDLKDGPTLVFDGQKAWVSPAGAKFAGARFNLLTWPLLLTASVRLQEPQISATDYQQKLFQGEPCDSFRIAFKKSAVAMPSEWYRVYGGQQDREIRGISFMTKEADGGPSGSQHRQRAVSFADFQKVEGVSLPTTWKFWNSDDLHGADGDQIGKATITNMKFIPATDDAFTKPADAREDESSRSAQ